MSDWGSLPARQGFGVVAIIGAAALDAVDAVTLAGGRLLQQASWDAADRAIDAAPADGVVFVAAQGVPPAVLVDGLDRIAAATAARGLTVVATFDRDALDMVAAVLGGGRTTLLCEPTLVEQVGALALAGQQAKHPLSASLRESEAERLQRLNGEVARIAEVLARLAGSSAAGDAEVGDRRPDYAGGSGDPVPADPQVIRQVIRARRMRDTFFPAGLFEDPAWDMLLDLYAAELEGERVSVSSLCIAAAVAPTTALRWIGRMTDAGLLERRPDPADRRRAFMALTAKAGDGMRAYLAAVTRAGLPIV